MAKDFLNLIERALMMGISDKINSQTASGNDIYVYGQYPESEELQFPAVVVQQVASGFQEKFYGENITFGDSSNSTSSGSGEVYGVAFLVHLFVDRDKFKILMASNTLNVPNASVFAVYSGVSKLV